MSTPINGTIEWIKYNADLGGDNRWYKSGGVTYSGWGYFTTGEGACNWKSIMRITLPENIGSNQVIDYVSLKLTPGQKSYPYKSCAVITPADESPLTPKASANKGGSKDVGPSDKLKKLSLAQSFALTATGQICTYSGGKGTIYYKFASDKFKPGKSYYIYLMRESTEHYSDEHGSSGWVSSASGGAEEIQVYTKDGDAEFEVVFSLDIAKKVNGGNYANGIISNISDIGTFDLEIDGVKHSGLTKYKDRLPIGTRVRLYNIYLESQYKSAIKDTTVVLKEDTTVTVGVTTRYTITFSYDDESITKVVPLETGTTQEYNLPTPESIGLSFTNGVSAVGWKIGNTKYKFGDRIDLRKFPSPYQIDAVMYGTNKEFKIVYWGMGDPFVDTFTYGKSYTFKDSGFIQSKFPNFLKGNNVTMWKVVCGNSEEELELGATMSYMYFDYNVQVYPISNKIVYDLHINDKVYSLNYGDALPTNTTFYNLKEQLVVESNGAIATWDNIYSMSSVVGGDNSHREIWLRAVAMDSVRCVVYKDGSQVPVNPCVVLDGEIVRLKTYIHKGDK